MFDLLIRAILRATVVSHLPRVTRNYIGPWETKREKSDFDLNSADPALHTAQTKSRTGLKMKMDPCCCFCFDAAET